MKRETRMKRMVSQIHTILKDLKPSEFNELYLQATLANLAISFGYAFRFYDDYEEYKSRNWKKDKNFMNDVDES